MSRFVLVSQKLLFRKKHTLSPIATILSSLEPKDLLPAYYLSYNNTFFHIKDTHREKARSNKSPVLTKSTNMDMWVVDTSN